MMAKRRENFNLPPEIREELEKISRSRTAAAVKVRRAKIILHYESGLRIADIVKTMSTNRPLIERCIDKTLEFGALTALDDLPRSGRPAEITDDAKSWVLSVACKRPVDLGYAAEVWSYSLLIRHIKKECFAVGHDCLKNIGKSLLNTILSKGSIKPHKISYYLEKRDSEFDLKMANVLCVYKEISMINKGEIPRSEKTTVSYDEKPGIQAIKNIAPQLQPCSNIYKTVTRDYEYKRLGTVSLLAGIDLHTGNIIPLVKDRHRSREFIEFLKLLDKKYPKEWTIRIILDNHSSHISKETRKYLKTKPNRFEFVFTPKHGSWLNMIEMFFSKIARGFLKHIRVQSKQELVERLYLGIKEINEEPVVFKWKYKLNEI